MCAYGNCFHFLVSVISYLKTELSKSVATFSTHFKFSSTVGSRAAWLYNYNDRLSRDQPESKPRFWFTLRQHLTPGKTTNWDHPGTTRKQVDQHPRGKYLMIDSKEIPNTPTIVDRFTRCHLAQPIPIPFHQDTLDKCQPFGGSEP